VGVGVVEDLERLIALGVENEELSDVVVKDRDRESVLTSTPQERDVDAAVDAVS
jgi:hypothetical protein